MPDLKAAGVGVHQLIVALSKPLWQNACAQMRNSRSQVKDFTNQPMTFAAVDAEPAFTAFFIALEQCTELHP